MNALPERNTQQQITTNLQNSCYFTNGDVRFANMLKNATAEYTVKIGISNG